MSNSRGIVLPLALFLVILMAALFTGTSLISEMAIRKTTKAETRGEIFFSSEMAAYQNYLLGGAASSTVDPTTHRSIVAFDNNYLDKLPSTLGADNYSSTSYSSGSPRNVLTTSPFDSEGGTRSSSMIRRLTSRGLTYTPPSAGSPVFCGQNFIGKQAGRMCLASGSSGGTLIPGYCSAINPAYFRGTVPDCSMIAAVGSQYTALNALPTSNIATAADLAAIKSNHHYKLTADITVSSLLNYPPGGLSNVFIDGNGHTIAVTIPSPWIPAAFFVQLTSSVLYNFKVDFTQLSNQNVVGTLAGTSCINRVGIVNAESPGQLSGLVTVLIGAQAVIVNSWASVTNGAVFSSHGTALIQGNDTSSTLAIGRCSVCGTITWQKMHLDAFATILNTNSGTATIDQTFVAANLIGNGFNTDRNLGLVAGLVGVSTGQLTISRSGFLGSSSKYYGENAGLIGDNFAPLTISDSQVVGDLAGGYGETAGFVATTNGPVSIVRSFYSGNLSSMVPGSSGIDGFVGAVAAGGKVQIADSYVTGSMQSGAYNGAFMDTASCTSATCQLNRVYASANATSAVSPATANCSSLSTTAVFVDKTKTLVAGLSNCLNAETTTAMQDPSNNIFQAAGWDFASVWKWPATPGYPILSWQ